MPRFDGEGQITEALYRLTSGEPSRAYATSNHGEKAISDTLTDALEAQNIEVESLSLLSGPVPEDCALLIVNCPASDFAGILRGRRARWTRPPCCRTISTPGAGCCF